MPDVDDEHALIDARLLLLEPGAGAAEDSLIELVRACTAGGCERVAWDAFVPETLAAMDASLVVAVPGGETAALARLFDWLRRAPRALPALAVLPAAPGADVLRAVTTHADDVLFTPVRAAEMSHRIRRLLPRRDDVAATARRLADEMHLAQLVGRSAAFMAVIAQLPRLARSAVPVLITGETGTGKELCARAIHALSARRDHPFIAVDCGTLPDHLVENELFGHARGAYTDAHRDQRGLISMAEKGTLFLDEIDALSPAAQGKLLRFLQERTFRPLGADRFLEADVNVIAATNRDLDACVRDKQFRADLLYRLNVLPLHLPPLRERVGDVGLLAAHFAAQLRERGGNGALAFSPAALRCLEQHSWPGNVRELLNVVQRAVLACDGAHLLPGHLSVAAVPAATSPLPFRGARAAAVRAFERGYVEQLLAKHDGNITRAAREAGKDRRDFGRLVRKYGLR